MLTTVGYDLNPLVAPMFVKLNTIWAYIDEFDPAQADMQLIDFAPALVHLLSEMKEPDQLKEMWAHWAANCVELQDAKLLRKFLVTMIQGIDEGFEDRERADREDLRNLN